MRKHRGLRHEWCHFAGTAATNVRQHWCRAVSAKFQETFEFGRVHQCAWDIFYQTLSVFIQCITILLNCFNLALGSDLFKLTWSRGYICNSPHHYHRIVSKYLSHFYHISVVVCPRWLYQHMLSVSYMPEKFSFVALLLCSRMMCAYNRVLYGPMVTFVCLHITPHHYHHMQTYMKVLNF